MFIIGIDTATPPQRYSQADCWKAPQEAAPFLKLNRRSKAILKKVLTGENGIATRHFALEQLHRAFDLTPDALHARFAESAPAIATLAAERALAHAQTEPREVDAFLISTCTGYLCPGLTSYVGERLGLRPDVLALDPVGQGCAAAAIPNLLVLRERFQLSDHDVRWSRSVLHEYGNMNSPSVWFVLQAALADSVPGGLWWMSSFGAGFSCHGVLLEVE